MATLSVSEMESYLAEMANKWPSSVVARSEIRLFTGGSMSGKTLANIDSRKQGPPRFIMGKTTVYPVKPLVQWILSYYAKPVPAKDRKPVEVDA